MTPYYKNIALLVDSLLIFTALTAIFGTIIYHVYDLGRLGSLLCLIFSFVSSVIIIFFGKKSNQANIDLWFVSQSIKNKSRNRSYFFLVALFLFLSAWEWQILISSATNSAIISPWEVIPVYFFGVYFITTFTLLIGLQKSTKLNYFLLLVHGLISFSIIAAIYKVGYGFDIFVHNAAIREIDDVGKILPKTWYYIGQYSLVLIIGKIAPLSHMAISDYLLPTLSAIFLPNAFFRLSRNWFNDASKAAMLAAITLVLSFSIFTNTNPQNLGYLYLLLTIIYGLTYKNRYDFAVMILLAGAALTMQPIAGIPAAILVASLAISRSQFAKIKRYILLLLYVGSSMVLPTLFLLIENNLTIVTQGTMWRSMSIDWDVFAAINQFHVPNQENYFLNFIYFFGSNRYLSYLLLAIAGFLLSKNISTVYGTLKNYLFLSITFFVSFLITTLLPFGYLIKYERSAYSQRILFVSLLFLLPYAIIALYWLIDRISQQKIFTKILFFFMISLIITANLYLSYPRNDNYFNSHGSSVGQNDISAVRWIENDARNDFVVLANQQTSAASLREFGFKKYFTTASGTLFYYPIPTSSPLYRIYLDMVEVEPTRERAEQAMALTGVDTAYFVLNKYWWSFDRLLEEAKIEADSYENIDLGEIYIFKYQKSQGRF